MVSLPELSEFSDGGISSAIITCGALIILIGFLGCCGAQWESKVFLFPYAVLVLVSVVAQLSLAGFLMHVHGSLVEVAKHDFDLKVLSPADQDTLHWINKRFKFAYNQCGLHVDVDLTVAADGDHNLQATCRNADFDWFAEFVEANCRIGAQELRPSSFFISCAGAGFALSNAVDEHALLCACETRMVSWINSQSMVVAVFVFVIVALEVALVALSFYVIHARRNRRHGYQDIRMPVRQQPYNPHPRNYFGAPAPRSYDTNAQYNAQGGGGGGGGKPLLGPSV
jgi:hypothetical protein